jgi:hypothetical protein
MRQLQLTRWGGRVQATPVARSSPPLIRREDFFFVSVVVACGVPGRRDKTRLMSDDQLNSTGEKKKVSERFFCLKDVFVFGRGKMRCCFLRHASHAWPLESGMAGKGTSACGDREVDLHMYLHTTARNILPLASLHAARPSSPTPLPTRYTTQPVAIPRDGFQVC